MEWRPLRVHHPNLEPMRNRSNAREHVPLVAVGRCTTLPVELVLYSSAQFFPNTVDSDCIVSPIVSAKFRGYNFFHFSEDQAVRMAFDIKKVRSLNSSALALVCVGLFLCVSSSLLACMFFLLLSITVSVRLCICLCVCPPVGLSILPSVNQFCSLNLSHLPPSSSVDVHREVRRQLVDVFC